MGRQGLNRPPQLHVAKGNTKCQSHQPQYVRAPAKRSSAKTALVQAVPAPLPRPGSAGTIPWQRPRPHPARGARAGEGPGPGTGARWEPGRRDNARSGTWGRQSHPSVKCQDAGGRPEGTLPGHCHHLIPAPRDVQDRLGCSILGEHSDASAVVQHGWSTGSCWHPG